MKRAERIETLTWNGLEAWIDRYPPYDCIRGLCANDGCPGGDLGGNSHGRGSAVYYWALRGEGLAVNWSYFADEHLPETIEALTHHVGWRDSFPVGGPRSYHAATRSHEWEYQTEGCELLGLPCYSDSSYLAGKEGMALLLTEGNEAVWRWLEDYWRAMFESVLAALKGVTS